jgi:alkylation response protein AidB-like acyl-CoA dehydrogenase
MTTALPQAARSLFDSEHKQFRDTVRTFIAREIISNLERWEEQHLVDRSAWVAAGKQGLIGIAVPEEYGGGGLADYRFRTVVAEEFARVSAASVSSGLSVQDDVFIPYLINLATPEQQRRWLPPCCSGEAIGAIAMTEPGAGSDLRAIGTTAVRDGETWVLNGAKTFITNGIHADYVIAVAYTDPEAGAKGMSLLMVERGMEGFSRGRKLKKVGLQAQDTAELFFDDVRVPAANLIGDVGGGFVHMMERLPLERLSIAVSASAAAQAALEWTVDYVTTRQAFGKPIAAQQNTQFTLAEIATEVEVTRTYIDEMILDYNRGTLSAVAAAKAKLWATEAQKRIVDRCVQLFGGYGYMLEYPIARSFVDTRVQTIYGGTSEIMKLIIGRDLLGR